MSLLNILSWNTRGLNPPAKRSLAFQFMKTRAPHICVHQETYLMGSRTLSLKKPWTGHHYYSTYSNFARGVSVLVRKSLPFKLLDLILDTDGRYILLHVHIECLTPVVVGLYLPPPASLKLLNRITANSPNFPLTMS